MDMMRRDSLDYTDIRESVRTFCAEKYYELERTLRPLVDGSFGEVLPGHLAAYLATVRQLGRLYQAEKPPADLDNLVPLAKVQEILAGMQARHEEEVSRAVAEAEARVRKEVASGEQMSISAAKDLVSGRLDELAQRVQGPN
jgi:hypothetical protein